MSTLILEGGIKAENEGFEQYVGFRAATSRTKSQDVETKLASRKQGTVSTGTGFRQHWNGFFSLRASRNVSEVAR